MKNHSVKFCIQGDVKYPGVILHPFYTYVHLTYNGFSDIRKCKSNDIGKSVMVEKLLVYFQQIFVSTKYIHQFIQRNALIKK